MNTKDYNAKINSSWSGRARTGKQSHGKRIAPLTELDNLNGKELEQLWNAHHGECAACHQKFNSFDEAQISHISPNGYYNYHFMQLLCQKDNLTQGRLIIPFAYLEQNYGKTFYQLFIEYHDWTIEQFQMDDAAVRRVEKRIKELGG